MSQADSQSTTPKKAKRTRSAARSKTDVELAKMAATKFDPIDLDLSKTMTNEQLGKWMVPVRVAALHLRMTKPAMIDVVRALSADDSLEDEGGSIFQLYDSMQEAKKTFEGLAEICETASVRLLVAAGNVAIEHDGREPEAHT